MTDEKMTDKTLANALAQQEAEYFQRHVDLTSKQYNLLLKLFQGAADSCLAEGRKRGAEEGKEREKQAAKEAWNAAQACLGDFGDGLARWDSTFEAWWEGREK